MQRSFLGWLNLKGKEKGNGGNEKSSRTPTEKLSLLISLQKKQARRRLKTGKKLKTAGPNCGLLQYNSHLYIDSCQLLIDCFGLCTNISSYTLILSGYWKTCIPAVNTREKLPLFIRNQSCKKGYCWQPRDGINTCIKLWPVESRLLSKKRGPLPLHPRFNIV